MPLVQSSSDAARLANAKAEMKTKSKKQAWAIAYAVQRRAKGKHE